MKLLVTAALFAAAASTSFVANAGPDESQRMMMQNIQAAKQKLAAAEAAQGAQRQKLVQEHMTMMQGTMGKMQAMKPADTMTAEQQKEWIAEHQKLMEALMGQMMDEHHLLMNMKCM